eukprot:m.94382 g.94382  ORF g.94382 m.94382 type:complete len:506 (+) comp15407_c0_seq2:43-1560(+)
MDVQESAKVFVEKLAARYASAAHNVDLDKKVARKEFGEAIAQLPDAVADLREHVQSHKTKLFDSFWKFVEAHHAKKPADQKEAPIALVSGGWHALQDWLSHKTPAQRHKHFERLQLLSASDSAKHTSSLLSLGKLDGACGKDGLAVVCLRVASQAVALDQLSACMETFFWLVSEDDAPSSATIETLDKFVKLCALKAASSFPARTRHYNDLMAALLSVLLDHLASSSSDASAKSPEAVTALVSASLGHATEQVLDAFLQTQATTRAHAPVQQAFATLLKELALPSARPSARVFLKLLLVARSVSALQPACLALSMPEGLLELLSGHSGQLAHRFVVGKNAMESVLALSAAEAESLTELLAEIKEEDESPAGTSGAAATGDDGNGGAEGEEENEEEDVGGFFIDTAGEQPAAAAAGGENSDDDGDNAHAASAKKKRGGAAAAAAAGSKRQASSATTKGRTATSAAAAAGKPKKGKAVAAAADEVSKRPRRQGSSAATSAPASKRST